MIEKSDKKVRYAVVGLGWFGQAAVLPAFANAADNSKLVALVTGDPVKADELSKTYRVPAVGYDEYDKFLASGEADAVYIALPNARHREYAERAAKAGVHVLCEKPMADTEDDCRAMIDACAAAKVKLMIAYRLHFEEANLKAAEVVHSGAIGEPRLFSSVFTQQVMEGNTRLDADLGGSPLRNIGVYCVNAARYLFRDDPVEVMAFAASNGETRFQDVPEAVSAVLRFPKARLATFACSFGAGKVSEYRVVGTTGDLKLDPAYAFEGEIVHHLTDADGKTRTTTFKKRDQVAAEILYFSQCVLKNQQPEPSGLEGLADVRIMQALEHSLNSGRAVTLAGFEAKPRPTPAQEIRRPASGRKPELVNAAPPGGS